MQRKLPPQSHPNPTPMQVLYALHEVSGDASHLALARKFNGWVFTAPLAAGRDDLADLPFPHANFHLPEVVVRVGVGVRVRVRAGVS